MRTTGSEDRFYTDVQLRWTPKFGVMGLNDRALAVGVTT